MKRFYFLLAGIFAFHSIIFSQNDSTELSRDKALKIYIDCDYCDIQYFKENFTLVSYVRDRKEADVQIIFSEMETGSGGTQYTIQFLGRNGFEEKTDTLSFNLPPDYSDEEERSMQLKYIQLGLVPYILKTPFADKIKITVEKGEEVKSEIDTWKNWVFSIHSRMYYQKEKSYTGINLRSGFDVNKVTEKIKVQFTLQNRFNQTKYRLYEGDSLVYNNNVTSKSYSFKNITTWSIGNHWGVGWFIYAFNSTYRNIKFNVSAAPAVEYNVFSYKEATHHQLRFLYAVGYRYNNYYDTTIYNKTQEGMYAQNFHILFSHVSKWGTVDADFSWENYLNDFSLYSVSMWVGTSVRLVKGLSLDLYGNIEIPRNQISLRKAGTTPEEVLTRQHEMQSDYSIWLNVGLSYTFGSIFNNVVNPRFEF